MEPAQNLGLCSTFAHEALRRVTPSSGFLNPVSLVRFQPGAPHLSCKSALSHFCHAVISCRIGRIADKLPTRCTLTVRHRRTRVNTSASRRRAETTASTRRRSRARTRLRNLCAPGPARHRRWPGRSPRCRLRTPGTHARTGSGTIATMAPSPIPATVEWSTPVSPPVSSRYPSGAATPDPWRTPSWSRCAHCPAWSA
jgi:hypothetical protein